MDKQSLEHLSDILFEHMVIGIILYTYKRPLTIDAIVQICKKINITKISPSDVIIDLILHGIASAKFDTNQNLNYEITEFGKYFFNTFFKNNINAKNLYKNIREYIL